MSYLLGLGTDEAYVESVRRLLATPKAYRRRCFRTVLILAAMFLLLYVLVPAGFAWLSGSKRDPEAVKKSVLTKMVELWT